MQKYNLKAEKRNVLGRKVKSLRKQGLLPANVFGKNITSQAISVNSKDFGKIFESAGETSLVDIELDGKKLPVLINNVTYHPVTGLPLHADLHQVDLKEKVTARVSLDVVGEAPAVKDKLGVLLTTLNEAEVEALPQDLPERIEVDVSSLKAIDEAVKIRDLKLSSGVKMLNDPELEVVRIAPLVSKEAEKQAQQEAEAAQAAAQPAEGVPEEQPQQEKQPQAKQPEAKKEETPKS